MPSFAFGESITTRFSLLARANAFTAWIFTLCSRASWSSGTSGKRMCTPSAGSAKSVGMTIRTRSGSTSTEAVASMVSFMDFRPTQQPE